MGMVQVDIHKAERQFELISFSDTDCIKALIKNRWMIDEYYGSEIDRNVNSASNVKPLIQELIVTYVALDDLIAKAKLNVKQRFIIDQLMMGYTDQDLAETFRQDISSIYRTVDTICSKIKLLNDQWWKYEYIYMNRLKVKWDYKKCSKCQAWKPRLRDFFTPDNSKKDGFKGRCKSCRSGT